MLMPNKNCFNVHYMEDTVKIFLAGFKKWAKLHRITQKNICSVVSKDQTTISNYFNFKTRPEPEMVQKWIDHYNLDENEIIQTGRKELQPDILPEDRINEIVDKRIAKMNRPENNVIDMGDPVKLELYKIINDFPNKLQGLELNRLAVQLAKVDPEALKDIIELIDFKLGKSRKELGQSPVLKKDVRGA